MDLQIKKSRHYTFHLSSFNILLRLAKPLQWPPISIHWGLVHSSVGLAEETHRFPIVIVTSSHLSILPPFTSSMDWATAAFHGPESVSKYLSPQSGNLTDLFTHADEQLQFVWADNLVFVSSLMKPMPICQFFSLRPRLRWRLSLPRFSFPAIVQRHCDEVSDLLSSTGWLIKCNWVLISRQKGQALGPSP